MFSALLCFFRGAGRGFVFGSLLVARVVLCNRCELAGASWSICNNARRRTRKFWVAYGRRLRHRTDCGAGDFISSSFPKWPRLHKSALGKF